MFVGPLVLKISRLSSVKKKKTGKYFCDSLLSCFQNVLFYILNYINIFFKIIFDIENIK